MHQHIQWAQEHDTERVSTQYNHSHIDLFNIGDSYPSPNSYTLPSLIGSKVPNKTASSAFSMAGRPNTGSFAEDLAKTPGPGRYHAVPQITYATKPPAYSMLGRSFMPGGKMESAYEFYIHSSNLLDSTKKPGPGAYSPENVYLNKPAAPNFSLGIRHSEFETPLILEASEH